METWLKVMSILLAIAKDAPELMAEVAKLVGEVHAIIEASKK